MSSIGQNFQADNTGDTSASSVSAPAASESAPLVPAAPSEANPASLNPTPTCIVLDEPYAMGDLEPGVTYPLVYITTLYLNGPALTMTATYEVGSMSATGWTKAPLVPAFTLQVTGAELVPFFVAKASEDASPFLWDQVETLLYKQVQSANERMAGVIKTLGAS